ncbi:hypothetical protein SE15_00125 [Thermanaerothrix daxensis]|uniref:Uncharacterized protein n=1 Tax=Thermanaerothrix daxensis TaxID=869279 RepID=A0A0P6Y315_9CHLR|nr:hypothetical protein SE15_00125 [Thermanaerothrix daxensis]
MSRIFSISTSKGLAHYGLLDVLCVGAGMGVPIFAFCWGRGGMIPRHAHHSPLLRSSIGSKASHGGSLRAPKPGSQLDPSGMAWVDRGLFPAELGTPAQVNRLLPLFEYIKSD